MQHEMIRRGAILRQFYRCRSDHEKQRDDLMLAWPLHVRGPSLLSRSGEELAHKTCLARFLCGLTGGSGIPRWARSDASVCPCERPLGFRCPMSPGSSSRGAPVSSLSRPSQANILLDIDWIGLTREIGDGTMRDSWARTKQDTSLAPSCPTAPAEYSRRSDWHFLRRSSAFRTGLWPTPSRQSCQARTGVGRPDSPYGALLPEAGSSPGPVPPFGAPPAGSTPRSRVRSRAIRSSARLASPVARTLLGRVNGTSKRSKMRPGRGDITSTRPESASASSIS